jgi:ribosomal protein L27
VPFLLEILVRDAACCWQDIENVTIGSSQTVPASPSGKVRYWKQGKSSVSEVREVTGSELF